MIDDVSTGQPRTNSTPKPPARRKRWIIAVVAMGVVATVAAGCSASTSPTDTSSSSTSSSSAPAGQHGPGGGSNARSGPAEGGSIGTVSSVSGSDFTLTTAGGQKVTVNESSGTKYQKGTGTASSSSVTAGESVLVLGMTNGTTITATQVTVSPPGMSTSSSQVIAFQSGSKSASKTIGQVPANYTEGSGTIVSGSTADQATQAALTAYPGGIVDRVVQLSDGTYEVHTIGVNWPHHVFVSKTFAVTGAN